MNDSFRVIAIIAAYNEEDIISSVIGHLAHNGIDAYLIDNHSTDDTVKHPATIPTSAQVRDGQGVQSRSLAMIRQVPSTGARSFVERRSWQQNYPQTGSSTTMLMKSGKVPGRALL